jgi:hypothetical protein
MYTYHIVFLRHREVIWSNVLLESFPTLKTNALRSESRFTTKAKLKTTRKAICCWCGAISIPLWEIWMHFHKNDLKARKFPPQNEVIYVQRTFLPFSLIVKAAFLFVRCKRHGFLSKYARVAKKPLRITHNWISPSPRWWNFGNASSVGHISKLCNLQDDCAEQKAYK